MKEHMMPKAIIFDLYGTLLGFDQRAFLHDLKDSLNGNSNYNRRILRHLLVENYDQESEVINSWCNAIGIETPNALQITKCREILQKHIAGIYIYSGVPTLLAFLKRRGIKLAVLSNASQSFTISLKNQNLESFFDCISYSCFSGRLKPDPLAYISVCQVLGVSPENCLFIGDSQKNDYEIPLSLGMAALCLRNNVQIKFDEPIDLSHLSWSNLKQISAPFKLLIFPGQRFQYDSSEFFISSIEILPDNIQGRYNILGHVVAYNNAGIKQDFFCKRYLLPESAFVEDVAYRLMDIFGMANCKSVLLNSEEPILIITPAKGKLWQSSDLDENTAEIIGSHCALAYMIGNADFRPRNTFVYHQGNDVIISIIDLEHCFFDRALDLNDFGDSLLPCDIDNIGNRIIEKTKHRVISPASTRRSRRTFLPIEDLNDSIVLSFRKGWVRIFNEAKFKIKEVEKLLLQRVYNEPPLIIGTQSYRRPMAKIDVQDIIERMQEDGETSFEIHY